MSVELSVVIPVHNEARVLASAVDELVRGLEGLGAPFEVWLAENGSTDGTREIAAELARGPGPVEMFSIDRPNYGRALQEGIARAAGRYLLCEEIDLGDIDFAERALGLLRGGGVDMVVGSKLMPGARDDRPLFRHAASHVYNALLRAALGYPGSDTHGLKAFRRDTVGPVAARCVVDRDVFASELTIRAYREGLVVREIPVELREKRPPSVGLLRRVPRVVGNLVRLTRAIGVR